MAIPIPSPLIEFVLLGPLDDRRQLQDSPILGDVWVAFGQAPNERLDLLIAPYRGQHAGAVAAIIDEGVSGDDDRANIAYLQGIIVARLTFEEVLRVVAPKTQWWISRWRKPEPPKPKKKVKGSNLVAAPSRSMQGTSTKETHAVQDYKPDAVKNALGRILSSASGWHSKTGYERLQEMPPLTRFLALTGLILWAGRATPPADRLTTTYDLISYILKNASPDEMVRLLSDLSEKMLSDPARKPLVWQVSLNRRAMPALTRSIPAVKADAATTLFKVNCSEIGWAVLDSGIDGNHPAFRTTDDVPVSRVKRSFDFKNFRRIVSLSNSKQRIREKNVEFLTAGENGRNLLNPPENPDADLKRLADDARTRGDVHWELVSRFVEIKPETETRTNHGTHVAGIIGANKNAVVASLKGRERADNDDFADGMCPDIMLYDFRVLAADLTETEFAIIAALQFIRYLNDRDNFLTIHGANLSLSIPHDVRNFACGRTPICEECERLVASGVVVVAAAGNHGYKSFETKDGAYDSYAAFSITDPGNADGVITVGATHRFWPHTYGVSFFSSRGPTGDGRLKPDLVAPGERIRAPFPGDHNLGGAWGDLDGTSMAAPHVSGAAAMLMARYSELIGQPRRIKRILCESATDLGRERSFQGHGMLDVLRSFQSI
jgi:serine protease AprX